MIFYRIGCFILLLTGCFHLAGQFQRPQADNETERQLFDLMINYQFPIGSETVTAMGLQNGFSFCFSLMFLWTGATSFYLSKKLSPPSLRSISWINAVALALGSVISVFYFFSIPLACFALSCLSFMIAAFRLK